MGRRDQLTSELKDIQSLAMAAFPLNSAYEACSQPVTKKEILLIMFATLLFMYQAEVLSLTPDCHTMRLLCKCNVLLVYHFITLICLYHMIFICCIRHLLVNTMSISITNLQTLKSPTLCMCITTWEDNTLTTVTHSDLHCSICSTPAA